MHPPTLQRQVVVTHDGQRIDPRTLELNRDVPHLDRRPTEVCGAVRHRRGLLENRHSAVPLALVEKLSSALNAPPASAAATCSHGSVQPISNAPAAATTPVRINAGPTIAIPS